MSIADDYDWSRFEIVFYYDAKVEDVFRAWATAIGLESFFIERAVFHAANGTERDRGAIAESGDEYRWEWRQPHATEGRFTESRTNERLSFTFGRMEVSISFATYGGQTELHLVQSKIPVDADGLVMGHLN